MSQFLAVVFRDKILTNVMNETPNDSHSPSII